MLNYATQWNPKLTTYLENTKMAFGEIDPRRHKFWLSVDFLKVYVQKKPRGNNVIRRLLQGFWIHT